MFLLKGGKKIVRYRFNKETLTIKGNDCYLIYETAMGFFKTKVIDDVKKVFILDADTFKLIAFIDEPFEKVHLYNVVEFNYNPYTKIIYTYISS